MLEGRYQKHVIDRLEVEFPGCYVLKNDSGYMQGIPDLIVLYGPYWAMLEVKVSEGAEHQPNQDYYISEFDAMSFGAFIYPENEDEVFRALQHAFAPRRRTRASER